MKNADKIKSILKGKKSLLRAKFGVKAIGLFGSYVTGEQKRGSDIDILVEFHESPDFFGFLELERFLHGLLKTKVDLVSKKALKPHIGRCILEQVEYI